jgi:hypothetical protein
LHSVAGAASTILDAEHRGRVIECVDVGGARIEGLTITGGRTGPSLARGGGLLSTGDSQLVISNCVIRSNDTSYADQGLGGGIYCSGGRIVNCEVIENRADGEHGGGGGIVCNNTEVSGCLVRGNRCSGSDGTSTGAGIGAGNSRIVDCRIEANVNEGALFGGEGGGIHAGGTTFLRCTIVDNRANQGGGAVSSGCEYIDCIFARNFASGFGGRLPPRITTGGAAIASGTSDVPNTITGCTIVGNTAQQVTGVTLQPAVLALESGGTVSNTIIAFNDGGACAGPASFRCMDVYGNTRGDALCGTNGGGNFSADPQFCAADPVSSLNVMIQSDSPCAPGNHPNGLMCGLIGAGPVACGTVAIERRTWTDVKSFYR